MYIYTGETTSYRYWARGHGKGTGCAIMYRWSGWTWYEYPCNGGIFFSHQYPYICQSGKMF